MMDAQAFRDARTEWQKSIPFSPETMDVCRRLLREMRESAAPEHVLDVRVDYLTDYGFCSCGWESKKYWDGDDLVEKDWREHVADEMGLLPRKCACGKEYVPADGGEACHVLTETNKEKGT